jgi:Integrase core domain
MLAGLKPSIGTVGDALDNGLAETTIGLYKTECVRAGSPFRTGPIRTLADLEDITSTWVCWYNASRLMHRLGRRPPTEAEANYYARVHQVALTRELLGRCKSTDHGGMEGLRVVNAAHPVSSKQCYAKTSL